jgi:enediyne biosynthesis protein E4
MTATVWTPIFESQIEESESTFHRFRELVIQSNHVFRLSGLFSLFCVIGVLAQENQISSAPMFQKISLSGVDFVLRNSPTSRKYLIETMPGGVALLDYNNDGLLDIFLVNAGHIRDPMLKGAGFDRRNPAYWNRLYSQNKDGSFTDVTKEAGLSEAGDSNYGMGVAVGDYDNDGFSDIYVTSFGKNVLYHNNGNGTFTDVTAKAGVAAGGWSVSAGFLDYDNDGKLDLFVTRYLDWDVEGSKTCGAERPTYCPPGEFPAISNILYHNRGDGTFEDVSVSSGIAAKKGHGLGVAFADYDGDGNADIFVANDVTNQFLFHNNGNRTFTETAFDSGAALTNNGKMLSGMGVAFQDYDNDGLPDLLVTQLPHEPYVMFYNEGRGVFSSAELETGFGALSGTVSGWGVGLEDFDNDGWKDAFIVQGHVFDNVEAYDNTLKYKDPPLLAMNRHGYFERANVGSAIPVSGRGAAFGDLNNDGWTDAITTSLGDPPQAYLNRRGTTHWLTIVLQGTKSNRDGFGATVKVNGQVRYATATGSYLSSNDKRLHFGLGASERAEVEIAWPSGVRQNLPNVIADHVLKITEPRESD